VGDADLAAVPLVRHGFHGERNYCIQLAARHATTDGKVAEHDPGDWM
jgi:hypothetical protein